MNERVVIVDWTNSAARVGVFAEQARGWQLQFETVLPPRLVVSQEQGEVHVFIGEKEAELPDGVNALVFEHPTRDLPQLEDPELQALLLTGFWRGVEQSLWESGQLRTDKETAAYVVAPHRFSQPLLESFHTGCAGERPLKFCGSMHEAAALVLGYLRSETFQLDAGEATADVPVTICLVLAGADETTDVVCFEYARVAPARHRLIIRDFFKTSCDELSARLHECDWLGAFSLLVVVEDPALPAAAQAALKAPLQAIAGGITSEDHQRYQLPGASQLKLRGAFHLALCAAGQAPDEQEYDVTHACHLGVQISQQHFQPVVNKDDWAQLTEFPHLAAQAFRLSGQPGNALRLNFYSGYSTRVADAVQLGHAMLWQEDLAQLSGAALTAAIRLDAPGSGEFALGVMPENRALRRQPFTLPGLVD